MQHPKKILLVQLYSNGDCLYATAVARQIKQDYPGCRLTWAISAFCSDIIALNPYVDEVWATNEVPKNNVRAFRRFRKKITRQQKAGQWDKVFITHNMDRNLALYDGTIRGMVLRAYPSSVTVPVQPVLVLSDAEKNNVKEFAAKHHLQQFKKVILWEYAPQSGQSVLSFEFVMNLASTLIAIPGTCVILSSGKGFKGTENILDASILSVRENAELTHYCHLLIGCSSGITWLSTSSAGKQLPMLQLLDPNSNFLNAPSVDFKRYGIPAEELIEITTIETSRIFDCVKTITEKGFAAAKNKFNQEIPVLFKTTRNLVYNLLCYLQFKAIARHYSIMTSVYGRNGRLRRQFIMGIITFPIKLIANTWRKRVLRTSSGK